MRALLNFGVLALAISATAVPAEAKGCLKGAGAVAGHYAGHHAVLGAITGCYMGHHIANQPKREQGNDQKAPPAKGSGRPTPAPQ
jgi:hypothetical protein